MPNFATGVSRYIHTAAIVEVSFPVDLRGHADISCSQCKFYRRNYRICGLTSDICEYPEKYVGGHCPLHEIGQNMEVPNNETSGL